MSSQTSAAVPTSLRAALWASSAFCASVDREELEDEEDVEVAAEADADAVADGVEATAPVSWPQEPQELQSKGAQLTLGASRAAARTVWMEICIVAFRVFGSPGLLINEWIGSCPENCRKMGWKIYLTILNRKVNGIDIYRVEL